MKMNKSASSNELVKKLYLLGQVAEHRADKAREHGASEEDIFSPLSMQEREQLSSIADKLLAEWGKMHGKKAE